MAKFYINRLSCLLLSHLLLDLLKQSRVHHLKRIEAYHCTQFLSCLVFADVPRDTCTHLIEKKLCFLQENNFAIMFSMNPKVRLLITCSIISISANLNYGFSTTYLNVPIDYFKHFLNVCLGKDGRDISDGEYNIVWNTVLHCWFLGFFVGVWLNPYFNERFGRKSNRFNN